MENLEPIKTVQRDEIFGSFFLGDSEFALSVQCIQEVVNPPPLYTPVPLGPNYLLGMFNLRGLIIPVIDLRSVLKLGNSATSPDLKKVAIVEYLGVYVGLIFDRTGEIFKSRNDERSDFEYRSTETRSQVVNGAFKLENGKRIVQILDPQALLQLEKIPLQSATKNSTSRETNLKRNRGLRRQCISFLIGPSRCALGIESIQEILKVEKIHESVLSNNECVGSIDLRGNVVPVIDFAALLGYRTADRSADASSGDRRVIVIRLNQELFGLLIDSIDSIITYFNEDIIGFPIMSKSRQKMFLGCISKNNSEDVILLDHSEIFSEAEIQEITHGHSKIYKSNSGRSTETEQKSTRKTYITFHLDNLFAVEIEEVREIIECPDELLHPPGLPKHFKGVLNLRSDLVAIVDARTLYDMEKSSGGNGKVLIFEKDGSKYGLVVDSVDAILSFFDSDKIALPELLYKATVSSMAEAVREAVQVKMGEKSEVTLLILNLLSIWSRIGIKHAA